MKKIILAVIAMLAIGTASAQFGVANSSSSTYVVYPMRAGVSLKYTKVGDVNEYFFVLNTTNQYDKPITIFLGDKAQAKASLSQLLNELFEIGKSHTLVDSVGKPFTATCTKTFGAEGYAIFRDGYAGNAFIRLKQISEMLEML